MAKSFFPKIISQPSNDHKFHHRSLQEIRLSFLDCSILHLSIWDGKRWPNQASLNDAPKWSNFQSLPELAFSSKWSWEPQTWYETIFYLVSVRENYAEPKWIQQFGERLPKTSFFMFVSAHCPDATSPQAHPNYSLSFTTKRRETLSGSLSTFFLCGYDSKSSPNSKAFFRMIP